MLGQWDDLPASRLSHRHSTHWRLSDFYISLYNSYVRRSETLKGLMGFFILFSLLILDSYSKWIRQKCYQSFINEKLKKNVIFLTCILPKYVPHETTNEFWKNNHFENMAAGFPLRCQKSLRWNTTEKCIFRNDIFHFHQYCPSNSYCPY